MPHHGNTCNVQYDLHPASELAHMLEQINWHKHFSLQFLMKQIQKHLIQLVPCVIIIVSRVILDQLGLCHFLHADGVQYVLIQLVH